MDFSFQRYLLSKRTVDDRALNKDVVRVLREALPPAPLDVIEIGAGLGTMIARALDWQLLDRASYLAIDESSSNIDAAPAWLATQLQARGLNVDGSAANRLRASDSSRDLKVRFERADVFQFLAANPAPADLLIAHAVLDLFPLRANLHKILSLTHALAWLTINFDGATIFEPVFDAALDEHIVQLYHGTMDTRASGGDSKTGRHLFELLMQSGAAILAAGSSDWVVYPSNGSYPADEAYFLNCILHFFEQSLSDNADLNAADLARWLQARRGQIARGELVCIAHQMDFLVRTASQDGTRHLSVL